MNDIIYDFFKLLALKFLPFASSHHPKAEIFLDTIKMNHLLWRRVECK